MQRRKKITIIITVVLAVILFSGWTVLAVFHLNSVDAGRYIEGAGTKFIAHQGYSARYCQNTAEAFHAAVTEGFFYGIETDVRRTADGVFVCSHDDDPFLDKTIRISQSSFDDIKNLPLDSSLAGEGVQMANSRICTLSDFLIICNGTLKTAVVEIKQKLNKEETEELVKLLTSKISRTNLIVCSFDKAVLEQVHYIDRRINIMLFASSASKAKLYAEYGYNVGVPTKNAKKKFISSCHKKGVYVNAYTVNDEETARALIAVGADFITTDRVLNV